MSSFQIKFKNGLSVKIILERILAFKAFNFKLDDNVFFFDEIEKIKIISGKSKRSITIDEFKSCYTDYIKENNRDNKYIKELKEDYKNSEALLLKNKNNINHLDFFNAKISLLKKKQIILEFENKLIKESKQEKKMKRLVFDAEVHNG